MRRLLHIKQHWGSDMPGLDDNPLLAGGPDQGGEAAPDSNPMLGAMPGQATSTPESAAAGLPPGMMEGMQKEHDQNQAQFEKMQQAKTSLTKIRETWDGLMKLGVMVDEDDVTKAGGHLVAAGLTPQTVAVMLSQMPPVGGSGLAEWIQSHDLELRAHEMQLEQQLEQARFQTSVSAMHLIQAHGHVQQRQMGPPIAMSSPMQNAPTTETMQ